MSNEMKKQTLEEWLQEAKERFGERENVAFKCPACGHVSTIGDFEKLGFDADNAYSVCIGRMNGKGEDGMKGKDKGHGCNWAAFGLFGTLGKGRIVVTPDGKEVNVFDFERQLT